MHWYPRYVPVDAQRARTVTEIHDLRARGVDVQPIELRGRALARGFWARHWCARLESFADYESRLPRGRPHVRSGAVCHLEVKAGCVDAMVVGSALQRVVVRVEALDEAIWKAIKRACAGRIGSVDELLAGRLPDDVANVLTRRNGGLLPTPPEIDVSCDCPHRTSLCAHAAAVLYGIGSRLDGSPALLFRLRGVDAAELLGANSEERLPSRRPARAGAVADRDLGKISGVDFPARGGASAPDAPRPPAGAAQREGTLGRGPTAANILCASADSESAAVAATAFRFTGERVARLRERTGFSVVDFATLLQVSAATVHRWESTPGPLTLRASTREGLTALQREIDQQED